MMYLKDELVLLLSLKNDNYKSDIKYIEMTSNYKIKALLVQNGFEVPLTEDLLANLKKGGDADILSYEVEIAISRKHAITHISEIKTNILITEFPINILKRVLEAKDIKLWTQRSQGYLYIKYGISFPEKADLLAEYNL